ncbi:hypothetical protein COY90_01540 [Candidatus Roizmanbacteria bacterium CG_4_10_14_0_8_um_filter_39_9]|uniref:Uncharacterized protein n=1 Tax=Candidatus Roizmanbacteria bacterium CG_4_10_14_0_8_um_filter_39_9 TaxID=1974829 RepID=A0A2M7QEF7_9BACT|nr:MAG: hypothetical protein COY90_01540 [Candidatus Roizmanbacteria bacterium CG_4_10_14_0_8_um_filter_39_9]
MVQISKKLLQDDMLEKLFGIMFDIIGARQGKVQFLRTFSSIFSSVEKIMIAKRVTIMYLLTKNIDHRTIAKVLKVSPSTVAKFSIILQTNDELIGLLRVLAKSNDIDLFFVKVFSALHSPGQYGVNWKNAWGLKRKIERLEREGI